MQHLVENNQAMVHEDAPLKFVQLVQLMRVATLESIEAIWAQYKNKPVNRWSLIEYYHGIKAQFMCFSKILNVADGGFWMHFLLWVHQ